MFSSAHIYELPLSVSSLSTFTAAAAGIDYLNHQCKIDHEKVRQHQEFMEAFIDQVEKQGLDDDVTKIAFGIEEGSETVELDPVAVNDQILLLEELEEHTVGRDNPFTNMRSVLLEHGGQPEEAMK